MRTIASLDAAGKATIGLACRLALVAMLVFLAGGRAAIAETDTSESRSFWLQDRERIQRQRPQHAPATESRSTHIVRRGPVSSTPSPVPASNGTPVPVDRQFIVAVLGDSLGQMLSQGLQEAFTDKPEVTLLRKARDSSGLVRDDFYDWPKAVRDMLAGNERIDVAVMMVGSNDRQSLHDGAATYDAKSPRWQELYGQRIEALAAQFRDRKIPLIWVGLPIMRNERYSADMLAFNSIMRDAATRAGAVYVDTWEPFADDRGQFDAFGPDINGQIVKIRAADGVHFTRAGARKLAHFVEGDLRRLYDARKPPPATTDSLVASLPPTSGPQGSVATDGPQGQMPPQLSIDVNEVILREAIPGYASRELRATLPLPDLPGPLTVPVKPAAGPVMALTAPNVASGGQLARARTSPVAASDAQALLDATLSEGRPLAPRAGRADDFSWPRR